MCSRCGKCFDCFTFAIIIGTNFVVIIDATLWSIITFCDSRCSNGRSCCTGGHNRSSGHCCYIIIITNRIIHHFEQERMFDERIRDESWRPGENTLCVRKNFRSLLLLAPSLQHSLHFALFTSLMSLCCRCLSLSIIIIFVAVVCGCCSNQWKLDEIK